MSVAKVMPARAAASTIIDIDEMSSVPTTIKVNGRMYRLNSLTIRNAPDIERARIEVMNANATNFDEVCEVYFKFISQLCDITLVELKDLSLVQLNKFFKAVLSHIRAEMGGQTLYEIDEEKKKTLSLSMPS